MSDEFTGMFDDDGEINDGSGNQKPSGLRAYAESQAKENAALRERIASLETGIRRSALADALDNAGKDPAAVSLIPADVADDKVGEWLEEHGHLISDKQVAPPSEGEGQEQQSQETRVLTDEEKALAAVSGAPSGAVPPNATNPNLDNLREAQSRDDFYDRLRAAQNQG